MLARRANPEPTPADVLPGVELPPLRSFLGPLAWVLVVGLPVLLRVGWQAAAVVAVCALIVREAHLRADRSTISFGEGFLAYRGRDGWPQGVQEDDDFRWNWKPVGSAQSGRGARA
jgi:hypothetical protein